MRLRGFRSVRTVLRWAFTVLAVATAGATTLRILHVLATRPVRPGGGPREEEASAVLYTGGCFAVVIASIALWLWIAHWIHSNRGRPDWVCSCGYDRRGLAAGVKCPECGTPASPTP